MSAKFSYFKNSKINTAEIQANYKASQEALIAEMVENMTTKLAAYNEWASKTLVKDATHPLTDGKAFADLFTFTTSKRGYPELVLFPWNETRSTISQHPSAAVSALVDMFGTNRFNAALEDDLHARLFDATLPYEQRVKTQRLYTDGVNGTRWVLYDWSNKTYKLNHSLYGNAQGAWLAKHFEVNLILEALESNTRYHVVLYREWDQKNAERRLFSRMTMTVADAVAAKGSDAEAARVNAQVRRDIDGTTKVATVVTPGKVVVSGIDLASIEETKKVVYFSKASQTEKELTVNPGDAAMLRTIEGAQKNGTVFTIKEG